jgi:hypothetical protein
LRAIARDIQAYWGSHLYVRVAPDATPCMDWREVLVPDTFTAWTYDQLTAILLHEWGHRMVSPGSPLRGAAWQAIARKCGLQEVQARALVNIAADAWVDSHYLRNPDWAHVYRRGEHDNVADVVARQAQVSVPPEDRRSRMGRLLVAFQRLLLRETLPPGSLAEPDLGGEPAAPPAGPADGEVEACAARMWDVLDSVTEPREERVRRLAILLKDWLPEADGRSAPRLSRQHEFSRRQRHAGDLTERLVDDARRAGLNDGDLAEAFGQRALDTLRARTERLRLYASVVPAVRRFFAMREQMAFTGYQRWHVGQPLRRLDLVATLQRGSRLIPNVNTLARHHERRGPQSGRGGGGVVIVVDDSGSTEGSVLHREKEAAFAVIAAARTFCDLVGLVVFGSGVTHSLALSTRYDEIEQQVFALGSNSGGTSLGPALAEARRVGEGLHDFAVMVMTDAEVGDVSAVSVRLREFPTTARLTLFCFNEPDAIRRALPAAVLGRARALSVSPDVPFAETALKEVYGH